MKIRVLLTEKVTYSKELNADLIAQFNAIQNAHPDWDEDECAKELWNSGKLPDFNNDEIIEQETTDISVSILKKYRKNG
ncbi:MAG: hypothetical protein II937_13615 [Bacteroidales bacterium]|nr:hypothetical protein [Bacteroidales bacterium]